MGLIVLLWIQFILFPKHQTNSIDAITTPPVQVVDINQRPNLSSYHLFGSSTVSEIPLDLLQAESSLDLIITGIIASDDPAQGRAYIRNRQGDEKKFMVGEDVYGLAELYAIYDDYLILKRANNKQERLSLSKGHAISTVTAQKTTESGTDSTAASNRIASHIKQSSDWQSQLDKQKFDANKIAQIASKVSVVRDGQGQIAGLRVSQLSGSSTLVKQGLLANDRIVSVNGVDISYQNILSLQKQLESSANVDVTVMRNGRKINLNLNLSEFQQ
ncbi:MAG: type II secretion system protein N [Marinicella sp.]